MTVGKTPGIMIEARRIPAGAGPRVPEDFTYTVVIGPPRNGPVRVEPAPADRRRGTRQRTRQRSAKIVDAAGAFVTDCLVHDLSVRGGRLRLPPGTTLPMCIQVYDEQTGQLHCGTVLWRRERDVGVALEPPRNDPRTRATAGALRRKFYAGTD